MYCSGHCHQLPNISKSTVFSVDEIISQETFFFKKIIKFKDMRNGQWDDDIENGPYNV